MNKSSNKSAKDERRAFLFWDGMPKCQILFQSKRITGSPCQVNIAYFSFSSALKTEVCIEC